MLKTISDFVFGKSKKETHQEQRKYFDDLATRILLYWIQRHGTPLEKKIATLNEAVKAVGIEATFSQDGDRAGWTTEDPEHGQRAIDFRKDLEACWPIGSFEEEQRCIYHTLWDYYASRDTS